MKLTNELLTDDFVLEGIWSKGVKFEEPMTGKLTYSYSDGLIQVEFANTNINFKDVFKTFYGQISRTKIVTLFNVRVVKINKNALQYTKIVADSMIISPKPIIDLDNSLYREISFTYENMNNWFKISPWKHDHINKSYYYEQPLLKKYTLESIGGILEEKICTTESFSTDKQEINLFHIPYYKLTLDQDKTIKELHQIVRKISLLFTFFLGKKANIQFLDFPVETKDIKGGKIMLTGRYYLLQQQEKSRFYQPVSPYSYELITKSLENHLFLFFNYFDKLKIIIQNFSVTFTGGNYVENSFLDASLNLEVFHRNFFPEKKVSHELNKAKKIIEEALDGTTEEQLKKKILSSVIRLDNITLRKKIFDLLRELPKDLLNKLNLEGYNFNNREGKGDFAMMCADTRNFITHGSSNPNLKVFSLIELINVAKVLNLVAEYHIMHKIGLKDEDIFKGIINKRYYQNIFKNSY